MYLTFLATNSISQLAWIANSIGATFALGAVAAAFLGWVAFRICFRYVDNNAIGIVEKLWSLNGSVADGRIVALGNEAGFRSEILRGGYHFGFWPWQYRLHRAPLVTISQGKIGYVYARDGQPLSPNQTLGRSVDCNHYQDARAFFVDPKPSTAGLAGQRGRQRAILREGVYAINLALFVVITEEKVFCLHALQTKSEMETMQKYHADLKSLAGFSPIVIGVPLHYDNSNSPDQPAKVDSIGIVTVHDGPSLPPDEIIAPIVGCDFDQPYFHNNFQDASAFLMAGGRRGRQYQTLTDGTYFINQWFATVEIIPKTVVPIGYVGVVVSYIGRHGLDLSGKDFRHGEQVAHGERGVWETPLGPGKYAFNTYAGNIILVPTTNFVLHWITGRNEAHKYDESLRSIDLVTKDAYEPLLPLSVVVHIDYKRAPSVIQRFGDVKKLITQTIDPMLSAFFRDVAHRKTMLGLLHERDLIQNEAREALRDKFRAFDIECVDVLIGKPASAPEDDKIETLLEQLRQRQLSCEQLETFERRKIAAEKLQQLKAAEAQAEMQTALTNAEVQARIAENQGEADLARARKQAEQSIVLADAELQRSRREAERKIVLADADSRERILAGRGESQKVLQVGLSEAAVLTRKISSFGDPRLFALQEVARRLASSQQPLVPERVFMTGSSNGDSPQQANGLLGVLFQLLVAEKSSFLTDDDPQSATLRQFADRLSNQVMANMESSLKETNGAV